MVLPKRLWRLGPDRVPKEGAVPKVHSFSSCHRRPKSASGCSSSAQSPEARVCDGSAPKARAATPLSRSLPPRPAFHSVQLRGGARRAQAQWEAEVGTREEGKGPAALREGQRAQPPVLLLLREAGAAARAAWPRLLPSPPPARAWPRGCVLPSPRWRSTRQVRWREAGVVAEASAWVCNRRPAGWGPPRKAAALRLPRFRRRPRPPSRLLGVFGRTAHVPCLRLQVVFPLLVVRVR